MTVLVVMTKGKLSVTLCSRYCCATTLLLLWYCSCWNTAAVACACVTVHATISSWYIDVVVDNIRVCYRELTVIVVAAAAIVADRFVVVIVKNVRELAPDSTATNLAQKITAYLLRVKQFYT